MTKTKTLQPSRYYVTTPIYYANGHPHLGNTYTTTLADSLNRFYKYCGYETFFLTGTDEHGDKVQQAAEAAGKTPQQFTDEVSDLFKRTWGELDLKYDRFIRTTEESHKQVVTGLLQQIYNQGDIYFGEYGGNYCVGCERFLTDKELVDGKCPDHQTVPQYVEEKNYFFKMEKYRERLIEHITTIAPDFIRPERYKNEVLAMLREPLEDLCISRPKTRLTWGIELPFDKNYVTYVWFDALINYLSGIDFPKGENFEKFWPVCEHFTAKDIIKPHGVFWPTMLMAAGLPLFKHLNVHGYWVTPTGKMSKSLGNVVDPLEVKKRFGMDVFRYFIFREMTFGLDGTFNFDSLETRYNADLANNLGNLVSRSLAMVHKYRNGVVPTPDGESELDTELRTATVSLPNEVISHIQKLEISRALEKIWLVVDAANVYIDRTKPWALAKNEASSAADKARLDTALYYQLECIRVLASLISPFMPDTSSRILKFLGFAPAELLKQQQLNSVTTWAGLPSKQLVEQGETLFPRIEIEKSNSAKPQDKKKVNAQLPAEATPASDGLISYDEFSKVELRVGQIMAAEQIVKSEKLIKLQVDVGDSTGPRQIIAGIAKFYKAEELVGRKVAVVTNLKPAKLMGNESFGMVLAASDDSGNLELVSVGAALAPGSKIK